MPIANDMKNIVEGIEVSYGERVAFVSGLFKETNETLKTFHREHQKMADDLWDFLSSDRTNREKVLASLHGERKAYLSDLFKAVSALRGKNKRELKAMAEQLAGFLKESSSATQKDTAKLMTQIKEDINSVEREVASLLSGFDRDLKEARQNWQNLARIMAAKRAGKPVTAKKIEGVQKKEIVEAVGAFTAGNLKEQILRLISEAASGISLSQMGKALRIPYIRLAKPASNLLKEGKIKKEGSEYIKV